MTDTQTLYNRRLGRYQAAIACEPVDKVPLATGSNYFAEAYAGYNKQEILYDLDKWLDSEVKFCKAYPTVDVLRNNRIYAPLYDALGNHNYKLPGRDLRPDTQFQFVEKDYMGADEYDELIGDPLAFMIGKLCPRIHGELEGPFTVRMANALFKAGLAQAAFGGHMRRRTQVLAEECGMPQPMGAYCLRDMKGIMRDMRRQPDKVKAACEAMVPVMIRVGLNSGDPLKRWPIFIPTHKPMFLSPKEFDEFYWPSFKKVMEGLIACGHTIRCYLEGNHAAHVHHYLELPKGTVLLDVDNQGDVFQVKKVVGDHQCVAGGLQDSLMIIGQPAKIRERVKYLCETIGREPGFIISGGCNIPYDTTPENFRALCDAVEEFGWLDQGLALAPKPPKEGAPPPKPIQVTPWEVKKAELGGVLGDEDLIKRSWDQLENLAFSFWMSWTE